MSLQIVNVPVSDLKHDPENPRAHDDKNLTSIIASLRDYGQVEPLVVQKNTMMVVGGNARLQSMKHLGWVTAACVVLDMPDEKARKLSIALNRTGELAGWNDEVLAKHLMDLSVVGDFDPESLGFTDNEMMSLIAEFEKIEEEFEMIQGEEKDDGEEKESDFIDGVVKIPAGMQPSDMKASHIRMIQLFYNEKTEPTFRYWVRRLAEVYKTDNISDTVYSAIEEVVKSHILQDDQA